MGTSYCGKNCDTCLDKEGLSCPGCKEGPGRFQSDECAIAACARARGTHCMECTSLGECSKFMGRNRVARQRMWDMQAEASEQEYDNAVDEYLKPRLPVMETWFRRFFWVDLVYVVAAIFSLDFFVTHIPALKWIFGVALHGALAAMGVCCLKMANLSRKHFATAGISALALLAIRFAIFFRVGGDGRIRLVILILRYAVELVYMLYLCWGSADILELVDEYLSRDWVRLSAWFLLAWGAVQVFSWIMAPRMLGLAIYLDLITTFPYYGLQVLRVAYFYKSRKVCWESRTYE